MTIRVNDPAYPSLPDEKSVTLDCDGDKERRLHIHPWLAETANRGSSEVYVAIGELKWDGSPRHKKNREAEYLNTVLLREDFVEAILAVFPELVRA